MQFLPHRQHRTSPLYTNQLMVFCEITNYCENQIKLKKKILCKNAATVFRRVSTRVNDFGCSLSNNAQTLMFNNISYYYGAQHYTSIRQFLTTACFILNDQLRQNTILKQWGSNEGF